MSNDKPVVFILDDNEDVCMLIQTMLATVGLNAQAFYRPVELLNEIVSLRPNCLVLDVRIPEMSGLEIQDYLNHKNIRIPIIFITGYGDVPMAVETIKRGAFNFIEKPFRAQELLDSIQRAVKEDEVSRFKEEEQHQLDHKLETLTKREKEVLKYLLTGKNNKIIAQVLNISPKTVDYHRTNILRKMRVDSLIELTNLFHPTPEISTQQFALVKFAV